MSTISKNVPQVVYYEQVGDFVPIFYKQTHLFSSADSVESLIPLQQINKKHCLPFVVRDCVL